MNQLEEHLYPHPLGNDKFFSSLDKIELSTATTANISLQPAAELVLSHFPPVEVKMLHPTIIIFPGVGCHVLK